MAKKAHRHARTLDGLTEEQADASYAAEVAPSLRLPAQVGNVYTGSLWLSLASLLDAQAGALEGQRIGLFSYGSGCAAEYFAGTVAQGAGAYAQGLQLSLPLEKRKALSFSDYEAIRRGDAEADRRPAGEPVPGKGPRFLGVRDDRRVYQG